MANTFEAPQAARYAQQLRQWLTTYATMHSQAIAYVNVAYARGYLQNWDSKVTGGLEADELNAIIDLLNEYINEFGGDDQTLVNKLRTDI